MIAHKKPFKYVVTCMITQRTGSGLNSATSAYLDSALSTVHGEGRRAYVETYGCQMNVADTEVVRAVLKGANYAHAASLAEADVVLLNTCAIREGAEQKIWQRLR